MRAPLLLLSLLLAAPSLAATRLKDLVDVPGVRDNALMGYGLVVGLPGTGDTESVLVTSQSLSALLGRMGIRIDPRELRSRNVAAVTVTARLPTFSRAGGKLDVTVSSLGNARSLLGGTLLMTPLSGPDGQVYAVAQGAVQAGGYEASAAGSSLRQNASASARVPDGATVERAVTPELPKGKLPLALRRPDFTNASRISSAITAALGEGAARAVDPAMVEVTVPERYAAEPVMLFALLEGLEIETDARARVVVSERTGTVVAGGTVRLRPAVVMHGPLKISIGRAPVISQPAPFGRGDTVSTSEATVAAEDVSRVNAVAATSSVEELAAALRSLNTTPRDVISIFQALRAAGSLDAELEVL